MRPYNGVHVLLHLKLLLDFLAKLRDVFIFKTSYLLTIRGLRVEKIQGKEDCLAVLVIQISRDLVKTEIFFEFFCVFLPLKVSGRAFRATRVTVPEGSVFKECYISIHWQIGLGTS